MGQNSDWLGDWYGHQRVRNPIPGDSSMKRDNSEHYFFDDAIPPKTVKFKRDFDFDTNTIMEEVHKIISDKREDTMNIQVEGDIEVSDFQDLKKLLDIFEDVGEQLKNFGFEGDVSLNFSGTYNVMGVDDTEEGKF